MDDSIRSCYLFDSTLIYLFILAEMLRSSDLGRLSCFQVETALPTREEVCSRIMLFCTFEMYFRDEIRINLQRGLFGYVYITCNVFPSIKSTLSI